MDVWNARVMPLDVGMYRLDGGGGGGCSCLQAEEYLEEHYVDMLVLGG